MAHYLIRRLLLMVVTLLGVTFMVFWGFNMLGDGLRDVLDPRLRGSQ